MDNEHSPLQRALEEENYRRLQAEIARLEAEKREQEEEK